MRIVPFAILLSSCVAYRAAPVDLEETGARIANINHVCPLHLEG